MVNILITIQNKQSTRFFVQNVDNLQGSKQISTCWDGFMDFNKLLTMQNLNKK